MCVGCAWLGLVTPAKVKNYEDILKGVRKGHKMIDMVGHDANMLENHVRFHMPNQIDYQGQPWIS